MSVVLALLKAAINHSILVDLKNGERYSGVLVEVDCLMNLRLKDAISVNLKGGKPTFMECYIKGNAINNFRIPHYVMDEDFKEEIFKGGQIDRGGRGNATGKGRGRGRGRLGF